MQINGASLSTAFFARTNEVREPVRPPVVIDVEVQERRSRPILPATTEASPFQTALTTEEGSRQARFVRLFAEDDVSSSSDSERRALPRGVEQYLQIADLDVEPEARLFDESV